MNKTLMGVLVALLVVAGGGLIYAALRSADDSINPTVTPPIVQNEDPGIVASTQGSMPTVVTNLTAIPWDTTVVVTGSVNPKGALTNYWYEFGKTSSLGNKTENQAIGSGFVAIQAPSYIINLTKNTTYYYRLVAENKYGRVEGKQSSFKTVEGNIAPVGSSPTAKTVSANNISRTGVKINGEVTSNKAPTQYWFEYGKTTDLGNTSVFASVVAGVTKTPVSVSLSNLEPSTTYYFRLNAQNQFGTVNGSILNFKTLGPSSAGAPIVTTGNATDIEKLTAILHGTAIPNLAETSYWFEYSTNSSMTSSQLQETSHVSIGAGSIVIPIDKSISGLKSNTTYYFRIVAQNNQGTVRGDKVTFKTK